MDGMVDIFKLVINKFALPVRVFIKRMRRSLPKKALLQTLLPALIQTQASQVNFGMRNGSISQANIS
jgi:hypothetical protein